MSTYETVVTRKGQVTIPADIRRSLGIHEGDRVSFEQVGDVVQIRRALDVVQRTAGAFAKYVPNPPYTIEEEREAFEMGVAEEVIESMNRR
ncbi:MAG TPA: AbrB/MazE/SpoVT family DNA-binding domain-containing protein [Thermomicrobiales bacterium]|jgi:AbrB family looped-hinge helix DNA binding protein